MPLEAVILIFMSAVLHAGWNLLGKSRKPSAGYFLIATLVPSLFFLPQILWFIAVHPLPPEFLLLLGATAIFQTIYFISLAAAYRSGEMSVTYPLARAVPILILAGIETATGHRFSVTGSIAALIVVMGCIGVGVRKNGGLAHHRSLVFALMAAGGTTGYTLIDHHNMGLLTSVLAGTTAGAIEMTLFYIAVETLLTGVFLSLYVLANRKERTAFSALVRDHGWHATGAGIVCTLAYALVLSAMPMVSNATYVAAFRQLSIPIGTTAGIVVLKEPFTFLKTCSVAAIFAGLTLLFLSH
ncbi:MAG: hypothetical protein D6820_06480 [Lentisphaerae bacterium]|nr:MAG: hypothetical protein D6820_06480 [Lentisphaerota bacterium]